MVTVFPKEKQASGEFNGGQIVENKPIGFPREGGGLRPYSNLFYWAHARAVVDSTIGLHPHQGFEICSFVLKGNLRHFDTKMNAWKPLTAGDVQIIRAGNGISHSEFMAGGAEIFQIWFDPSLDKTLSQPATYDDYKAAEFPVQEADGIRTTTLVGPGSPFRMDTPGVQIQRLQLTQSRRAIEADRSKIYAAYILEGTATVNGEAVKPSDFVLLQDVENIDIQADASADVFLMENPAQLDYRTYAGRMRA